MATETERYSSYAIWGCFPSPSTVTTGFKLLPIYPKKKERRRKRFPQTHIYLSFAGHIRCRLHHRCHHLPPTDWEKETPVLIYIRVFVWWKQYVIAMKIQHREGVGTDAGCPTPSPHSVKRWMFVCYPPGFTKSQALFKVRQTECNHVASTPSGFVFLLFRLPLTL